MPAQSTTQDHVTADADVRAPSDGRPSDPAFALDLRVLRFRMDRSREEPTLLALQLIGAGRTADALEVVDAALALDPDDLDVLLGCGIAAAKSNQLAFAQLVLTRAATRDPKFAEALSWLARVLSRRERHEKAVLVARLALAAGDDDPEVRSIVRRDDRATALAVRLDAYRADREAEEPAMLARELIAQSRVSEALALLEEALSEENDADLHLAAADARLAMGDLHAAEGCVRAAMTAAPTWAAPALRLATMQFDRGAVIDALTTVESSLEHARERAELRELHERIVDEMRTLGIDRPGASDAALDALLGTLDRVDPIGDETRMRMSPRDSVLEDEAPVARRAGWLPKISRLFGRDATAQNERAPSKRPVARA